MARDILDAVYGCLIGGAIGDAMGAPVEGWYYQQIREKYGKVTELMPYKKGYCGGLAGAITDDSTLRHYMCLAIVQKGGRITPDDFARIWLEKLNPKRLWLNEIIVHTKLKVGMNPWDTGKGNPPAGCATMAISPIGIINAGNPAQAYQDGFNIAFVNQDNADRDAAATEAAGVAAAFTPGATVESVLAAMMEYSSDIVKRAIILTMDLAHSSDTVDEFAEKFYATMLDWTWPSRNWNKERFFSGSSLEIVPVVMALLHLCEGDVNQCIIEGASFGRDCDTISSVVGGIAGGMQGASAISKEWIDTCEKANEEFFEELAGDKKANFHSMAVRLIEVLKAEKQKAQDRVNMLGNIIG